MTRHEALSLMEEYTQKQALRHHMLGVEASMRQLARRYQEDEEKWGITGILHDFDYEKHMTLPDHPVKGVAILREMGVEEDILEAILGHANLPEYPRTTQLAKALFAADELTGLVTAVTYVRPSRSVLDVEVSSVKKKLKDKTFAAGVSRADIAVGAEELGLSIDELIEEVVRGLQAEAEPLGLAG